ncbi:MAG: choice-of-anchor Q domain-containing protein [Rudaea sp.]
MHCSTITLTSGQITVKQNNLAIKYDGTINRQATISGNADNYAGTGRRIFKHTGNGTLRLQRLNITDGSYGVFTQQAIVNTIAGGCVTSSGIVDLEGSDISMCFTRGNIGLGGTLRGGAVYAARGVIMNNSSVTGSGVVNYYSGGTYSGAAAEGGGVFANGYAQIRSSTIAGNEAFSDSNNSSGGGIAIVSSTSAPSLIEQSTIANNKSVRGSGVLAANHAAPMTVQNSTISGNGLPVDFKYNHTPVTGSAIFSFGQLTIANSTLATNIGLSASALYFATSNYSAGVVSSILADNTVYGGYDIGSRSPITLGGKYNLISTHSATVSFAFPQGQRSDDPQLLPLKDNGGPTLTHALKPGSPALGRGSNSTNLTYDQRGPNYMRVVNGLIDIGAYEEQVLDHIFVDGFE